MSPLEEQLRARIEREGPISVADYMAACNAHYYATRDPLGRDGDFITAPEISQMFGELVGAWLADLWDRAGRPDPAYVELGPGRGTLAADALRVMAKAGLKPSVHFVETSPTLRAAQANRVADATWHDDIETLPIDRPLLIVANEFFDALPVEQYGLEGAALRVALRDGRFVREGLVLREASPASTAIAAALGHRLAAQGGAMLIADYGYAGPSGGDTLQALSRHAFADPWEKPGERDITAHVGFAGLAEAGAAQGARIFGPVGQGRWLDALGIGARAQALARTSLQRVDEIESARHRLTAPDQMGELFKVAAMVSDHWPEPAGFAA
jgi:NADH dehydrogenase [ubiquinone] 1 alpha subcomplex assembly factor 7